MFEHLIKPAFQFATVIVVGALLAFCLRTLGTLVQALPQRQGRRQALSRAIPVVGALVWATFAWAGFGWLIGRASQIHGAALLALSALVATAAWGPLRDYVAGVVLKAGRVVQVGDHVHVGDVSGKVQTLGRRTLTLETTQGEEAIVPFSRVSADAVLRVPVVDGASLHEFNIAAPEGLSVREVREAIQMHALNCCWSSLVREPELRSLGQGRFEVTVFALDKDYASDIEMAVRRAPVFGDVHLGASR
jgi:small-conductance mechanosensitive channel